MDQTTLFIAIFSIVIGLIGAGLASWKKRNPIIWFLVCSITLLIGLVIILVLPKNAQEGDAENKKKISFSKVVYIVAIVGVAIVLSLNLQHKKQEVSAKAKSLLTAACNNDTSCLANLNKRFDGCIKQYETVTKTSKLGRKVNLDMEDLKVCINQK